MKTEIIDMHCHLLPGIDDGAKNMHETLTALRTASEQGISKIIMTPHLRPDIFTPPEQLIALAEQVNCAAKSENIAIDIFLGEECMYFNELPSLLSRREALSLAGSHYVLVEFEPDASHLLIERGLENILETGYTPILAHYERYMDLSEKGRLSRLRAKGCLLQLNYDTIQLRYGPLRRNPYLKDLKSGIVDYLGSDCHGTAFRPYCLTPSVAWLRSNLSPESFQRLTNINPSKIIDSSL